MRRKRTKNCRCAKCGVTDSIKQITRHHVFPLRLFPDSTAIMFLCEDCHEDVEELLRSFEKKIMRMEQEAILQIQLDWLSK